jgi:hypothetical protein
MINNAQVADMAVTPKNPAQQALQTKGSLDSVARCMVLSVQPTLGCCWRKQQQASHAQHANHPGGGAGLNGDSCVCLWYSQSCHCRCLALACAAVLLLPGPAAAAAARALICVP